MPLYVGRHPGKPARRARGLLGLVGLSHRLGNKPSQLSGENAAVSPLPRARHRAGVVIMDQPTGNLDKTNSANVLQLIRELRASMGATFLIATHDAEVAAAADRAIAIVDGMVAA